MERKTIYYVSGNVENTAMTNRGDGTYARATHGHCEHKHKTVSGASKCAENRRKTDGFIVVFGVGFDGYCTGVVENV